MSEHLVAHGSAVALASIVDDQPSSWIEVIPAAEKRRNGPWFFTVTTDDLGTYAQSIGTRPGQIPVDYDHQGDLQGSTRAAGWFTGKTQVVMAGDDTPAGTPAKHDALYAEVEWTPRAVEEIRGGEFKFTSPVFTFAERDPKTGLMSRAKEIVASTLTNRPHFRQMGAVTASDLYDETTLEGLSEMYDPRVASLIRAALGTSADDLARDLIDNPAVLAATTKETSMKVIAQALGLAEDATEEQIAAAVKASQTEAAELKAKVDELTADPTPDSDSAAKIAELEARLEAQAAERTAEKIDAALDTAIRDRKIVPAQKDVLAEQFKSNLDGLVAVLAATPARPGLVGGTGTDDSADPDVDAVRARYESDYPVDEQSAALHAEALKIMGKAEGDYTVDEYARAIEQAERSTAAA